MLFTWCFIKKYLNLDTWLSITSFNFKIKLSIIQFTGTSMGCCVSVSVMGWDSVVSTDGWSVGYTSIRIFVTQV